MALALFDLDETLLPIDSDYLWSTFMVEQGYIQDESFLHKKNIFKEQYNNGALDIYEYIKFLTHYFNLLGPKLKTCQNEFIKKVVKPVVSPAAINLVKQHKDQGDHTIIITATSEVIVRDIAHFFAVHELMAVELETVGGRAYKSIPAGETVIFTGEVRGIPSFREGKVARVKQFLQSHPEHSFEKSYFYSDSRNDIPLLEVVSHAFAVNPDKALETHAKCKGWKILDLHGKSKKQ